MKYLSVLEKMKADVVYTVLRFFFKVEKEMI